MAIWLDLADAVAFIGLVGTVLAVSSAVLAGIAFAVIGSPDVGAAATIGWLITVILSLGSGFAGNWHLPVISIVALPCALLMAGAFGLLRTARRTRTARD